MCKPTNNNGVASRSGVDICDSACKNKIEVDVILKICTSLFFQPGMKEIEYS